MVSVIILSYNTKDLLRACLNSVFTHTKDIISEVIVVDNASHDDSVSMVKSEFKQVVLLENKENLGFSKGCNLGAKRAKGKYLFFLNSDTEIVDDMLRRALSLFKQNRDIAVVGGLLKNQDGTTSRSHGKFFTFSSIFSMLFLRERFVADNKEQMVDWVSGGCMLVKRDIFEKVHGFDEHFFMYIEDAEICYRIKHLGYSIMYYPEFSVKHKAQGSSNRSFAIVEIYKGILYYYKKHRPAWDYFFIRVLLGIKAIIVIVISAVTFHNEKIRTYKKALGLVL